VLLGIGASSPGEPFDLDAINEMTKKVTGTELLGYFAFIARDPSAQRVMEENAESVMDVMFAADSDSWNQHLHPMNGLKKFVEGDCRQKVGDWFPLELQKRHLEVFGRRDGYLGPLRYYMMLDQNLSVQDEKDYVDFKITQPVLVIIPKEPEGSARAQVQMISGWAQRLTVVKVDSGHWVHMERSGETNKVIEEFLGVV
jgi:soluble epoxide hydrolase / lipid-phosphate phosphatase